MIRSLKFLLLLSSLTSAFVLLGVLVAKADGQESVHVGLDPLVTKYFKSHCYKCHGERAQKGDRRLDQLPLSLGPDDDAVFLLTEALDAINRGDMPPVEDGVTQPPAEETRRAIESVTAVLNKLSNAKKPATTTMRRLNRFEYANTLRDLLGLRESPLDMTNDFPADAIEHGFDNNGEALTLSDYQLQRYVEVAEAALDKAIFFDREKPEPDQWVFKPSDFNGVASYERAPVTWRLIKDEYMEVGHGQPSERHPNFPKKFAREGVPVEGWYTIRIRASAANRLDHGYDHAEFERFKDIPLKMALWIAPEPRFLSKNAADKRRLLKVWDLRDGEAEDFEETVWLEKSSVPFVSWTNGISSKGNILRVARKHHPEVIRATKTQKDSAGLGNEADKAEVERLRKNENNKLLSEVYHGPCMRIWGMSIEGPIFRQWPPASHQLLIGGESDASKVNLDKTFQLFASRAFRRRVDLDEVQHYLKFVRGRIEQGESPAAAIKLGMAAILTSPRFLYLDEGNSDSLQELNQFELASRLSYFLWSTMPDNELFRLANSKKLAGEGITNQVERMLKDERASDFVEHFTDTWLRINILGSMPPDSKTFGSYYKDRLEELFKRETRLFFADLIATNKSIENLLDSEYTFLNDALARHYGVKGVKGESFRKVALKPEHRRGGLLGQGSVLTLTANGIETSPVVRGVWVLENIFGTPPSPPPSDVEPLEPDTRGTTTIREQLDKHRNVAACADCHRKIDPVGFALEFYDPVGALRTRYPARKGKGILVDGAGVLPSGESFADETGLKKILLDRKEQFAETLAEKLLTYSTGRNMTFADRAEVKRIANECVTTGFGLRDLIQLVVASEIFKNR